VLFHFSGFFLGGNYQWAAVIVTHASSFIYILSNVVKNAFEGIAIGKDFNILCFVRIKDPRGLYYKTFYSHNLRIFVISQSVCVWQAFPAMSNVCG
jgi:hypothetical protein